MLSLRIEEEEEEKAGLSHSSLPSTGSEWTRAIVDLYQSQDPDEVSSSSSSSSSRSSSSRRRRRRGYCW